MADLDLLVLGDANPDLVLTGEARPAFGHSKKVIREPGAPFSSPK